MKTSSSSNSFILMKEQIEKPPLRYINPKFSIQYLLGFAFFYIQFIFFIVALISPYWLESQNEKSLEFTSLGVCFVC